MIQVRSEALMALSRAGVFCTEPYRVPLAGKAGRRVALRLAYTSNDFSSDCSFLFFQDLEFNALFSIKTINQDNMIQY